MSEEPAPNQKDPDDDAWIDRVANVAGHLGFNKTRIRWKLIRWRDNRKKQKNLREQKMLHVGYAHKTCPQCSAVNDKDEKTCTVCGAALSSRRWQMLGRLGILSPVGLSISTVLALAILAVYARQWILAGGGLSSPTGQQLVDLGGRWPPLIADEPWRLLTACFLHGSILHLAFNLIAIAQIGPRIEDLYGRSTALGLFVITGVVANLGTLELGPMAVGIGASGGLMGLIGVAAGWGQRAGRGRGFGLRDDMLKWSAYTFIFGFAVKADNWAHLFGLLAGFAFGYLVKAEKWKARKAFVPLRILIGVIGAGGTIAAVALVFTRHPTPPPEAEVDPAFEDKHWMNKVAQAYIDICAPYYNNDMPGAVAALTKANDEIGEIGDEQPSADAVKGVCDGLQEMRAQCTRDKATMAPAEKKALIEMCDQFQDVFAGLPVRPPPPLPPPPSAGSATTPGSGSAPPAR